MPILSATENSIENRDMKEEINNSIQWEKASKAGIALGLVSSAYLLISSLLARFAGGIGSAFLLSLLSMLLWSVKFIVCIGMMKWFMLRLKVGYNGVTSKEAFRFGMKIALLSAIVYTFVYLANLLYISNDVIEAQWDLIMTQYATMMDSNTLNGMEQMKDSIPAMSAIFNLVYCFLFGTILSKILAKTMIPDEDIHFGNPAGPEDQNGNTEE